MASKRNERRRYSKTFKAQVIAQCAQSGISIAQVAMSHGLNAGMVRRWRRSSKDLKPAREVLTSGAGFISLPVQSPMDASSTGEIRIAVRCRDTTVDVHWPISGANACAQWLREWLH